jgi:hypothetical protein
MNDMESGWERQHMDGEKGQHSQARWPPVAADLHDGSSAREAEHYRCRVMNRHVLLDGF